MFHGDKQQWLQTSQAGQRIVSDYSSCLVSCHLGLIKWLPTVIEKACEIF